MAAMMQNPEVPCAWGWLGEFSLPAQCSLDRRGFRRSCSVVWGASQVVLQNVKGVRCSLREKPYQRNKSGLRGGNYGIGAASVAFIAVLLVEGIASTLAPNR